MRWCEVMWGGEGCREPPTAPLLSLLSGHNSPLGSGAIERSKNTTVSTLLVI